MGTTPSDYPMALTVNHVAEIMGISRSKAYEIMQNPKFPVIREGRRLIIPRDAFLRWMDPEYAQINPTPSPSLSHADKSDKRDRVTAICIEALVDAISSGRITVQEVVMWAFNARLGR